MSLLEITLSTGEKHVLDQIGLFDSSIVSALANLRQQAATKLGGVSSGIGFIGSPGWVLAGAVAASALESIASNAAAKEGMGMLSLAAAKSVELRGSVHYFEVKNIADVAEPNPELWLASAEADHEYNLKAISRWERGDYMKRHGIPQAHFNDETVSLRTVRKFIHDGGEFVRVARSGNRYAIRWSQVATYRHL